MSKSELCLKSGSMTGGPAMTRGLVGEFMTGGLVSLLITSRLKTEPKLAALLKPTQNQCIYKCQKVNPVHTSGL